MTPKEKLRKEFWRLFGDRFQVASNLPVDSIVKSVFGKEIWSWILKNFKEKGGE